MWSLTNIRSLELIFINWGREKLAVVKVSGCGGNLMCSNEELGPFQDSHPREWTYSDGAIQNLIDYELNEYMPV